MGSRLPTVLVAVLLSCLFSAGPLHAQDPASAARPKPLAQVVQPPAGPPATPRHTGIAATIKELGTDIKYLPTRENAMWLGIGTALALAAHPEDTRVNHAVINSAGARTFFKVGSPLGQSPTLLGASIAIYATGRIKDEPRVSHVGMDLLRAIAISEGLTETIKYTARRERPDHSGRNSFPSGHAADTFAFATALERHLGWRYAVPAYVFSSYVALSRLPANRHWLSDTMFGAAVGIIAGRTVTGHESSQYHVSVAPVRGGAVFVYTRTLR